MRLPCGEPIAGRQFRRTAIQPDCNHAPAHTGTTAIKARNATRGAKRNSPVTANPVTDETPEIARDAAYATPDETTANPEPVTNPEPETAPETAPVATVANAEPAAIGRRLHRDAATIAAYRTNYGTESNRDAAYAAFFYLAGEASGAFTLRQAFDAGTESGGKRFNPLYSGSSKATDAGAVNRLRKAGYISPTNADCTAFVFTERGEHFARSTIAKLMPAEPAS